jgi:hypothetical protein
MMAANVAFIRNKDEAEMVADYADCRNHEVRKQWRE